MLSHLIVSRVRVKLLELFYNSPDKRYHVREIVRQTSEEINAVRRELAHLEKAGILEKEPRGNRLFYKLRSDYPLFNELLELVSKTSGLGGNVIKNRIKLGKIKYFMLSGSLIKGRKPVKDQVEALVVGQVVLPELTLLLKDEEKKREREINFTLMTEEEFAYRKKHNDPFIKRVLWGQKMMIVGDEEEMLSYLSLL